MVFDKMDGAIKGNGAILWHRGIWGEQKLLFLPLHKNGFRIELTASQDRVRLPLAPALFSAVTVSEKRCVLGLVEQRASARLGDVWITP